MFGKFFASTFTGSMFGAGCDVFAVWGYVIAHAIDSTVELNPAMLAAILGADEEKISKAIEYLCDTDPKSRNTEEDGRRLVHESAYQYRVVSHARYRAIRNDEDRRVYNRDAKRRERSKKQATTDGRDCVYFVRDSRGLVKIGFSNNPTDRASAVSLKQNGAVGDVEVLALVPGTRDTERAIHMQFGHLWVDGEWFRYEDDLIDYVKRAVNDSSVRSTMSAHKQKQKQKQKQITPPSPRKRGALSPLEALRIWIRIRIRSRAQAAEEERPLLWCLSGS